MLMHADLLRTLADDRRRTLIAESDRQRLLSSARRARHARRSRNTAPAPPVA